MAGQIFQIGDGIELEFALKIDEGKKEQGDKIGGIDTEKAADFLIWTMEN